MPIKPTNETVIPPTPVQEPVERPRRTEAPATGEVTVILYDPYAETPAQKPLPVDESITVISYDPYAEV